jgi:hypothetical protein
MSNVSSLCLLILLHIRLDIRRQTRIGEDLVVDVRSKILNTVVSKMLWG